MAELMLGPLLRYVDEGRATVWVETSKPCEVRVLNATTPTFTVHGRHYAIAVVENLEPGTSTPYTVELDGDRVWPPADRPSRFPASVIRTARPGDRVRVAFGSCRITLPAHEVDPRWHGVDALHAMAERGIQDPESLPDLLFFAGDQVYADEVTGEMSKIVRFDDGGPRPPEHEVVSYEEYARLYGVAWSEQYTRWLLSTVPTVMIFDDHDVHDDWNTSQVWREQMAAIPWWPRRITAALSSYWVYQHAGNLHPDELAKDELYRSLQTGGDGGERLDDFARSADREPEGTRWSYLRDLGRVRLLVLDTRAGRVCDPARRAMLDATEWNWIAEQAKADVDHLLIGSSLPVVLPRPLHDIEGWDEVMASGRRGRRWARLGERIRQGLDFEHWAAFRTSFDALIALLRDVATTPGAPASIVLLSGDVHYSYRARLSFDGVRGSSVHQVVCSPLRNPLGGLLRLVNVVTFWKSLSFVGRLAARHARLVEPPVTTHVEQGPWFDNAIATVEMDGRAARVVWEKAVDDAGRVGLEELASARLA